MTEGSERRRASRVPICVAVTADCDAWTNLCHTKDISTTGIFLISQKIPSPGTGFSLKLQFPGIQASIRLKARVVRIQGDNPRGFAIEYKDPNPECIEHLRHLAEAWRELVDRLDRLQA